MLKLAVLETHLSQLLAIICCLLCDKKKTRRKEKEKAWNANIINHKIMGQQNGSSWWCLCCGLRWGEGNMKPPSMNRNCICLQITERYLRLFIFIYNNSTTALRQGSSIQATRQARTQKQCKRTPLPSRHQC